MPAMPQLSRGWLRPRHALLMISAAFLLGACTPTRATHGYVPRHGVVETVRIGQDTREVVQAKLGRPSTIGTFDSSTWLYVSQKTSQTAFFAPEVTDRQVLAITFDENGRVATINRYGLEDGRVIDLVTRTTPTHGQEMTLVQQLFANIGRFNPSAPGGGFVPSSTGRRPGSIF